MNHEKKTNNPFGTFDSELHYQEINIPDGFEATIKDNKIILKRKESEDERIRKAIHIYLDWLDGRKDYTPKGKYSIKDMIAWLEKQGESYTKKDVDNAFVEGMAFAKNELEKQNKQKPQGKSVFEAAREEVMRFISLFEKQKSYDKVNNANKVELKDYNTIDPHFGKLID